MGIACCMLIAGIWLFSGWYQILLLYSRGHAAASVGIFYIQWASSSAREQYKQLHPNSRPLFPVFEDRLCVELPKVDHPPQLRWMLPCWEAAGYDTQYAVWRMSSSLRIPFWLPFALMAIPTAFLWYRDRRIPPGHCQHCGYNLKGLTEARCPECGQSF